MSTIKSDKKDLEFLLNNISPINFSTISTLQAGSMLVQPTNSSKKAQEPKKSVRQSIAEMPSAAPVSDSTSGMIDNPGTPAFSTDVRLFEFDIDAIRKGLRKRARKTVMNMAKHILPEEMMEREYIQDKIEQDIETLADLYVQVECNKTMQASLIDAVSRGNGGPRSYEVFGQLTDKIAGLNKQALATEQTIRKTYIDLKFEIRDKDTEAGFNPAVALTAAPQTAAIPDNSVVITSSKDLNNLAKQKHREMLERAEKAKSVSFTETN